MKLLAPLFLFPLLATNLQAGGLVPSQVDAGAHWVAHIDLESFHKTQLYQALLEADEKGEIQHGLNELLETEGIDLFRDVRGATLYGTGPKDEGAVALIATNASAEPALERWQKKLGAKSVDVAGRACLEWKDGEKSGFSFLRTEGSTTNRLLVVSKSKETLANALDVLQDKRPSLAKQPSAELSTALAPGSFAFLAAAGMFDQIEGMPETGPESTVARLAQGVRVELGEHDGRFFLDARLRTKRDEDALKVQQILQGLLALVSIAAEEPEGATLTRWAKGLEVTHQAQSVQLHFEYDTKLFIQEARGLDALDKEKKAEKAENGEKSEKPKKEKAKDKNK
jgi:hypothetical protein